MRTERRNPGRPMSHPAPEEWMTFLYGEAKPAARREMQVHLETCDTCRAQMDQWRATSTALDTWQPKRIRRSAVRARSSPATPWAVAAAALAIAAFLTGRVVPGNEAEIARLKQAVAELSAKVADSGTNPEALLAAARSVASEETVRLLSDYDALQATQRRTEQETVKTALARLDSRVDRLRGELETVAFNTQEGFVQTHQNLAQLVSYSAPKSRSNTWQHD